MKNTRKTKSALRKLVLPLLVGSLPLLSSCDSGEDSESSSSSSSTTTDTTYDPYVEAAPGEDITLNPTARALVMKSYLQNDAYTYINLSGAEIADNNLFNLSNGTTFNTVRAHYHNFPMTYRKTGDYEFYLEGSSTDRGQFFETAVQNLIGEPAQLGDDFRARLIKSPPQTTPNFSRTELQSIADDLNNFHGSGGHYIYLLPDVDLLVDLTFGTFKIYHTSFSLNSDLLSGVMNGEYSIDVEHARVIEFRHPTADELIHFNWGIRGFTPSHWLPIIGRDEVAIREIQIGDYDMALRNIPIGVVR